MGGSEIPTKNGADMVISHNILLQFAFCDDTAIFQLQNWFLIFLSYVISCVVAKHTMRTSITLKLCFRVGFLGMCISPGDVY